MLMFIRGYLLSFINLLIDLLTMSDFKRTKRANTTTDKSTSSAHKIFDPELDFFGNSRLKFESFTNKNI